MVTITYNKAYGLYEAAHADGHVFIALPDKQEVLDTLENYGITEYVDRTV
jgi:hypothetical protein